MRSGSLFSGAGGLDLAVEAVFGGETVWHCEVDPAASKVFAARWPDVPNLGDIVDVDWDLVRKGMPIEVLCGGFPCQDVSTAGRRAGIAPNTRSGLWAHFATAIAALRPQLVVIENVRGLLSARAHRAMESENPTVGDESGRPVLRAAGAVLGDLADLGYDAQWCTIAAADVGACHRRERVFIVATDTACDGRARFHGGPSSAAARGGWQRVAARSDGRAPVANTEGDRRDEGWPESTRVVGGSDAAVSSDGPVTLLPTPIGRDYKAHGPRDITHKGEAGAPLSVIPSLLPTPGASDGSGGRAPAQSGGTRDSGAKRSVPLTDLPHLLPTPEAKNAHAGPDYARMQREGSGGHDLVTAIAYDGVSQSKWGKYEAAILRWEAYTRPAPSPTEPNSKGRPRLHAPFSEWMQGWPAGWCTDPALGISRNDQLRIIGNGACPQQAHAAILALLSVCEVAA